MAVKRIKWTNPDSIPDHIKAEIREAELSARIAVLELDNFRLVQRAELAEAELAAALARERWLRRKLCPSPLAEVAA